MKKSLIILLIFIAISGCKEEFNKGAAVQMSGPYNGILPCADCEGIIYEINLIDNMTYTERMIYIGKNIRPISASGRWELEGLNKVNVLKQSDELSKFEYSDGNLIILDPSGNRITGPDADKFILKPGPHTFRNDPYTDTTLKYSKEDSLSNFGDSISALDVNKRKISKDTSTINGLWKLIEINGKRPEEGNYMNGIPDLEIRVIDNKFSCNTGCNRVNGGVQIKGNLITFSKFLGTKMTCPGTGEKDYISTMTSVDSYTLSEGVLELKAAGKTVLKYSR